jgi:hypothetical protein
MQKHIWTAALAAAMLGGLATIPAAHGAQAHGDALATVSAWQTLDTTARAAAIVCARHLAKDAPPGTEGLVWEPAFQEPCSDLHTRLEAVEFGAERLAGDGAVADREILRQAGLPIAPR